MSKPDRVGLNRDEDGAVILFGDGDTNNVNESSNSSTDIESAFSNTAVRYFNTKDWYSHIQNNSLDGIPMDVDMKSLNHFEHKYGRTPDIVRLAIPLNTPSHTGLMEPKDILDHTHGGARAAAVGVDCYSSYVSGKLLKSVANPELFVEEMIMKVENAGHKIQKLAADSGVLTASVFQVITPKVESLCLLKNITPERAEPYNHARGTGAARVAVKVATGLIRIIITSNFRAASDGGGLNVYPHLDRGLSGLLNEQDTNNKESKKLVAEEDPGGRDFSKN
eukprot:gene33998-43927_t